MSSSHPSFGAGNHPPPATPAMAMSRPSGLALPSPSLATSSSGEDARDTTGGTPYRIPAVDSCMLSPETASRMRRLVGGRASKSSFRRRSTDSSGPTKRRYGLTDHEDGFANDDGAFDDLTAGGDSTFNDPDDPAVSRTALLEYGSVHLSSPGSISAAGAGMTPSGSRVGYFAGSVMGAATPLRTSRTSNRSTKRSRLSTSSNVSVRSSASMSLSTDSAAFKAEIDSLREQLRKAESERYLLQSKYDRDVHELEQRVSDKDRQVDELQKKVEEYKIQRNAVWNKFKAQEAQLQELNGQLVKAKEEGFVLDTTLQTNSETSQTRIKQLEAQLRSDRQTADRAHRLLQDGLSQSEAKVKKLQETNKSLALANQSLTAQLSTANQALDDATKELTIERRKTLLQPRVEAQRKEVHEQLLMMQQLESENNHLKLALQRNVVDAKRLASVEEQRASLAAQVQALQTQVGTLAAAEAELRDKLAAASATAASAGSGAFAAAAEVDALQRKIKQLQDELATRTESATAFKGQVEGLKVQLAQRVRDADEAEAKRFDELKARRTAEALVKALEAEVAHWRTQLRKATEAAIGFGGPDAQDEPAGGEEVERELRQKLVQAEERHAEAEARVNQMTEWWTQVFEQVFGWRVQPTAHDASERGVRIRSSFVQQDDCWIDIALAPHPSQRVSRVWTIVGYGNPEYERFVAAAKSNWDAAVQGYGPDVGLRLALCGFLADLAVEHCRNPSCPTTQ